MCSELSSSEFFGLSEQIWRCNVHVAHQMQKRIGIHDGPSDDYTLLSIYLWMMTFYLSKGRQAALEEHSGVWCSVCRPV